MYSKLGYVGILRTELIENQLMIIATNQITSELLEQC